MLCVLLWSDTFLIDAPNQALHQGVKVEVCERWGTPHVEISGRVYQELATGEEYVLREWTVIQRHSLTMPPTEAVGP